jgi:hypothetical protein
MFLIKLRRFVCTRLKIFAVRILLVQMLEAEEKVTYDGMDGAVISVKFDAFVA